MRQAEGPGRPANPPQLWRAHAGRALDTGRVPRVYSTRSAAAFSAAHGRRGSARVLTHGRARASTHANRSTTRTPARRVSPPGRPAARHPRAGLAWTIASRDLPPKATTARGRRAGAGGGRRAREGQTGHLGAAGDDELDAVISRGRTGTARPRSGAAGGRLSTHVPVPRARFAESSMLLRCPSAAACWLLVTASASISAGDRAISWRDRFISVSDASGAKPFL